MGRRIFFKAVAAAAMGVALSCDAGADGILMECVDYNNYTDEMCNALK